MAAQSAPPVKTDLARAQKLDVPIVLSDGTNTVVKRTRRELGFRLASASGPVAFTADKGALKDALGRIGKSFRQPAIDARPVALRGQVTIKPGVYARSLNVATTAERLAAAVRQNPATTRFAVTLDKKPPTLTAERLKGITGVLGSYQTTASADAKRNNNIKIAVESIDGTLLSPGETFSLNGVVGKRTQARGFRTATVFVDAEKVPGVGGGVSQVTGTLFNAAALAGLKINEVNPHSRPVSYIPVGRDATVAYGSKDLKFTNNTGAPVFVGYTFANRRLRATLFGQAASGRKVTLRPRVQRMGPGKIDAQLYRVVRTSGGKAAAKERIFRHAYRWDPAKD